MFLKNKKVLFYSLLHLENRNGVLRDIYLSHGEFIQDNYLETCANFTNYVLVKGRISE